MKRNWVIRVEIPEGVTDKRDVLFDIIANAATDWEERHHPDREWDIGVWATTERDPHNV